MHSLLMYSQSVYPIQRVENKDTVVVMTKAQAVAINNRYLSMDSTIKAYNEAYKFKYLQYSQAVKALDRQDSVIAELNRQLLVKPSFRPMTTTDIVMTVVISMFGTFLVTLP